MLNVILSFTIDEELNNLCLSNFGTDLEIGERLSVSDTLCKTCVDEHVADGDAVTVIGKSERKNCSSCGTQYKWRL